MEVATPFLEVAEAIEQGGAEDLNVCYQCATCTGSCPWGFVEPLNVRRLIHLAQLGLEGYEGEDIWRCTTCNTCKIRCPRGVGIVDLIRSIRMMIGETGLIPQSLRAALGSTKSEGNPWSGERKLRNKWAADLGFTPFDKNEHEYLLFACCMPSYDSRSRKLVEAVAKVLSAAGIRAGVLGSEESCCGESIRKIGDEGLFGNLAEGNGKLFAEHGVERVLVISPHCYHTFKNEYPELGTSVQVTHMTELMASAIAAGKLDLKKPVDAAVTYHDPCYLGRHNEIYDAPREVLRSIPGVKFTEMIRNRDCSLCCGGGGGRMWMETKFGERFSDLRIPEALGVGADVLATACPYCINMFEDSRLNLNKEDEIRIKDVTELVAEALA
ncbi:MAG: (Fe-S)-binding protein [Deltaproteobacteria bacterium]|nr:(Fe-S)-binding protein [Deltaproteobacteria bacterium]